MARKHRAVFQDRKKVLSVLYETRNGPSFAFKSGPEMNPEHSQVLTYYLKNVPPIKTKTQERGCRILTITSTSNCSFISEGCQPTLKTIKGVTLHLLIVQKRSEQIT